MGKHIGWVACAVLVGGLYGGLVARAQTDPSTDLATNPPSDYRTKLEAQLAELETQIGKQQQILDVTKTQDVSLSRDVAILDAQIAQAQLSIQARDITIQELTAGITDKESQIFGLNTQLNGELESLATFVRQKNQLDDTPVSVAALSSKTLSEFFSDNDTFDQINEKVQQSFGKIKSTRDVTEQQEADLETQREEETQLRQVQELQKSDIQDQQNEKNRILKETKGQEKAYQMVIAQNQKSASQIRSALFQLNGSAAIPFDKALSYAEAAEKQTGIRPAFLLGIIAEESDLGENVGTGSWTVDMHPTRDMPIFKAIAESLGQNPNTLPVSKKAWYGWGGAMGPAQFIPSTWACFAGYINSVTGTCANRAGTGTWSYDATQDKVGTLTGNTPPNPWNPQDAFMASALYLTDSGADSQTPAGEFKAAMCYLAGCGNTNNQSLQFYGQQVAALAQKYQCEIDVIDGKPRSGSCN